MGNYKVEMVEIRKKQGKDFLHIKILDKMVGFFKEKDKGIQVKEGDIISCEIVQKGKYLNGMDLKVMDRNSPDLTIEKQLKIDRIIEEKSDRKSGTRDLKLHAGSRIYHFEIKESSKGDKYLVITEQSGDKRNRLFIFEDHADAFSKILAESLKKLK